VYQCNQCGANLPDEAKFCMQCGSAVTPREPPGRAAVQNLDFIQPALAGGMFLAILSSIPIISAGNYLCCMWIVGGGALAAYMLRKQTARRLTYGDGAFAGVLSGLFGAVGMTMISIPLRLLAPQIFESQRLLLEEAFRETPELQGPLRDLLIQLVSPEISAITLAFTFFGNVLVNSIFAMIGGIAATALMNRKSQ
jgi:hypothetical protein